VADYTLDNDMASITYELSDREIYNDVRAELGFLTTDTVVDDDADYEWNQWTKYQRLPAPGVTTFEYFTATLVTPLAWKYAVIKALDDDFEPYGDYEISLIDTNDPNVKATEIKNTGSKYGSITYTVSYKYLAAEEVTHEEQSYNVLNVRATDDDSILKYGRRVLPLVWPQGTNQDDMQMIVNAALAKYKEPLPTLRVSFQGKTDALATQIFTREISDTIEVVCDDLGMTATTFYLDSIAIKDSHPLNIPLCTWGLTQQSAIQAAGWFLIDTDSIDGAKLIA